MPPIGGNITTDLSVDACNIQNGLSNSYGEIPQTLASGCNENGDNNQHIKSPVTAPGFSSEPTDGEPSVNMLPSATAFPGKAAHLNGTVVLNSECGSATQASTFRKPVKSAMSCVRRQNKPPRQSRALEDEVHLEDRHVDVSVTFTDDSDCDQLDLMEVGLEKVKEINAAIKNRDFLCEVCGDSANGHFFGAMVCLPCKSFFIRCTKDAEPDIQMQCRGTCHINRQLRNRCQYCRFQRCLSIGMSRKDKPEVVFAGAGQELCKVCGDLANGLHFGVFTCEGCKKFFRRALKEHETYVCRSGGQCQMNPRTRNHCRYCRYTKCLSSGMSREAIKMGRPRKILNQSTPREASSSELPVMSSDSQAENGYFLSDHGAELHCISVQQSGTSGQGSAQSASFLSKSSPTLPKKTLPLNADDNKSLFSPSTTQHQTKPSYCAKNKSALVRPSRSSEVLCTVSLESQHGFSHASSVTTGACHPSLFSNSSTVTGSSGSFSHCASSAELRLKNDNSGYRQISTQKGLHNVSFLSDQRKQIQSSYPVAVAVDSIARPVSSGYSWPVQTALSERFEYGAKDQCLVTSTFIPRPAHRSVVKDDPSVDDCGQPGCSSLSYSSQTVDNLHTFMKPSDVRSSAKTYDSCSAQGGALNKKSYFSLSPQPVFSSSDGESSSTEGNSFSPPPFIQSHFAAGNCHASLSAPIPIYSSATSQRLNPGNGTNSNKMSLRKIQSEEFIHGCRERNWQSTLYSSSSSHEFESNIGCGRTYLGDYAVDYPQKVVGSSPPVQDLQLPNDLAKDFMDFDDNAEENGIPSKVPRKEDVFEPALIPLDLSCPVEIKVCGQDEVPQAMSLGHLDGQLDSFKYTVKHGLDTEESGPSNNKTLSADSLCHRQIPQNYCQTSNSKQPQKRSPISREAKGHLKPAGLENSTPLTAHQRESRKRDVHPSGIFFLTRQKEMTDDIHQQSGELSKSNSESFHQQALQSHNSKTNHKKSGEDLESEISKEGNEMHTTQQIAEPNAHTAQDTDAVTYSPFMHQEEMHQTNEYFCSLDILLEMAEDVKDDSLWTEVSSSPPDEIQLLEEVMCKHFNVSPRSVMSYWNQLTRAVPVSLKFGDVMPIKYRTILDKMLLAYNDAVNLSDNSKYEPTFQDKQDWPQKVAEAKMCWSIVQKRILRGITSSMACAHLVPGLERVHPNDKTQLVTKSFCFAMTVLNTLLFFDIQRGQFKNFFNFKMPENHPMTPYRVRLLNFGRRCSLEQMDLNEVALLFALNTVCLEGGCFEDEETLYDLRQDLLMTLASYLICERKVNAIERMGNLFRMMPRLRMLGHWHSNLTKNMVFDYSLLNGMQNMQVRSATDTPRDTAAC